MTPETEKQKQIHFQNIYAAAIAAGWVWIDKFTFRSPSESTHDLSAADPAKLDSIEKEGHFKTCDTLDELMARPSTNFFDRPDPETCNKKFINNVDSHEGFQ